MSRSIITTVVAILGLDLTAPWARPPVRRPASDATPHDPRPIPGGRAASLLSSRFSLSAVGVVGIVICSATLAELVIAVPVVGSAAIIAMTVVVGHRHRRAEHRRAEVRLGALPQLIDALVALIRSGLTPSTAWRELARCSPPAMAEVVHRVIADLDHGSLFADALARALDDLGPSARGLVDALVTTERYGLPLVPALDRLSADAAAERRRLVEARSRQLPVRLSIPLVVCILPAFVVLGILPVLIATLSSLTRP